ncbi:hypothetical protein C8R43DRAFT_948238 [Mycena crocata]|nr:hypothetical protein C8R43DRAFT_948238 [Mycena crocata]
MYPIRSAVAVDGVMYGTWTASEALRTPIAAAAMRRAALAVGKFYGGFGALLVPYFNATYTLGVPEIYAQDNYCAEGADLGRSFGAGDVHGQSIYGGPVSKFGLLSPE